MPKSFNEVANIASGVILAVATVLEAFAEFTETGQSLFTLLGIPQVAWVSWPLIIALFLLGLWLLSRGLSRKSRLINPERLLIDPKNGAHLRGRDDEIRWLLQAVADRPLVFLEGESGCGKSALILSGMIPTMREVASDSAPTKVLLPIYVNYYGDDRSDLWDEGLRARLADETWSQLNQDLRTKLGIASMDDLREAFLPAGRPSLFHRIHTDLGLIPILILDQFEDYLVTHLGRFRREGRWIAANELTRANGTWRRISKELSRDAFHLLIVTRREWAPGLIAVQFTRPEGRFLERVAPAFITALLDALTEPDSDGRPVVADPDAGWIALKGRLIRDLVGRGRILPIQARVVFQGLSTLPYLSIGEYERKGGISGLEAEHIEAAAQDVHDATGVPSRQVLRGLLALVDESEPSSPKTRNVREIALAEAAGLTPGDGALDRMLEKLKQKGIIKRQFADGVSGGVWSLYHDYLAKDVLAAIRRADRWQRLLQERHAAFETAIRWRERWRTLLSPWELVSLVWPSIRGKIRWAGYRRFGVRSGLRLAPLVVALGVIIIARDQALDWQAKSEVKAILSAVRGGCNDPEPKGEEFQQLWGLASGDNRLKRTFVTRANSDSYVLVCLGNTGMKVASALFGLDPKRRLRVWTLQRMSAGEVDPVFLDFVTTDDELVGRLTAEQVAAVAGRLVQAMTGTDNRYSQKTLDSFAISLISLSERMTNEHVAAVAGRLVQAMTATDIRYVSETLDTFGTALERLGERLTDDQVGELAGHLVQAIIGTDNSYTPETMDTFAKSLISLNERMTAKQAEEIFLYFVDYEETSLRHESLINIMGSTSGRFTDQQVADFAGRWVDSMISTKSRTFSTVGFLAALSVIGERLTPETVALYAGRLLAAITASWDGDRNVYLVFGVMSLIHGRDFDSFESFTGDRLLPEQGNTLAIQLEDLIAETGDPFAIWILGYAMVGLGEHLPPAQANAVLLRLVKVMATHTDPPDDIFGLGVTGGELAELVGRFSERLTAEQANDVAQQLLDQIAVADLGRLDAFAEALGSVGERLTVEQARDIVPRLSSIVVAADSSRLLSLLPAIGSLGKGLTGEQANDIIQRLVDEMAEDKMAEADLQRFNAFAKALDSLGKDLTAEQANNVVQRLLDSLIVERMDDETFDAYGQRLDAIAKATGILGERLLPGQVANVAGRFVGLIGDYVGDFRSEWALVFHIGPLLKDLGDRLTVEQAQDIVPRLYKMAMDANSGQFPRKFMELVPALGSLAKGMTANQANEVAQRLVDQINVSDSVIALEALGGLGEGLTTEHANDVVHRLLDKAMVEWPAWYWKREPAAAYREQLDAFGEAMGILGDRLTYEQVEVAAGRLVRVMTTDYSRFEVLREALVSLCERLLPEHVEDVVGRLVEAITATTDQKEFTQIAEVLALMPVPSDSGFLDSATDLLQAPLAYGATKDFLLRYYSRAADAEFKTTDDLIAWASDARRDLDLSRTPQNPFRRLPKAAPSRLVWPPATQH